ncbi:MAG: type II secretion system F family protein [Candidatus Aenigmatarchaeota archaeon]
MNKKFIFQRISINEKIFFARNLALLLKSGVTLPEALLTLKESTKSSFMKHVLGTVLEDIQKGQFLSSALFRFENKFGKFFISLIQVGEESGNLINNLNKIAIELEKIYRLRNKIITTLLYPAFIIFTLVLVIIVVVYFLFPKILPIFEELQIELPFITKLFLKIVKLFLTYDKYLFISFILLVIALLIILRNEKVKFVFSKLLLHLPFLSQLLKKYFLAEFSRNMSILLESGMPIVQALEMSGEAANNLVYKKVLTAGGEFIAKGHSFTEFLKKYPLLFPYTFVKMIDISEKTGTLSDTLIYLSENYEEEISVDLERFVNSVEPMILIVVATMVAFIALAIVLPIYELSDKLLKK